MKKIKKKDENNKNTEIINKIGQRPSMNEEIVVSKESI